jgi:signal transduction histidine kinase
MGPTARTLVIRYGTAVLASAAALLARLLLDPLLGDNFPFFLPCLAVVVVAWHGGLGPSLLALLVGLLATAYLFLPPRYDLVGSLGRHQALASGFLILGGTISVFSEALQAARRRAEAHARELEEEVAGRKGLELELQKRAEQLAEADRRKDAFLATLAHELRNPLAPLRNGFHILRLAGGDQATAGQVLGMMERQLGQMVHLIDDLLDVSRITRGKLRLRRERVDLAAVVQAAVEASRPLIEAPAHRFEVVLPPGPVWLDADPTRLAQVLSNLLTNAAKYTKAGGSIRLAAWRQGREVVVSVKDTGIGIAPEHLPRLFEMFSQVESALDRSQGGLGIGLSLVRGLVGMHGGFVEAHSEGVGKGSEFLVRLPVATGTVAPDAGVAGGEAATPRRARRVLVADDNPDTGDSLAMMLRLGGHEVHTARDGQEAVAAAAWFRPDVALLDIGMPRLNGYEAARSIREHPGGGQVVLVAVTGWGQEEDRRRAAEAGFDHHLTKPADPADLERLLASLPPR